MIELNVTITEQTERQGQYGAQKHSEVLVDMGDHFMTIDAKAAAAMLRGLADRIDPVRASGGYIHTGTIGAGTIGPSSIHTQ